MLRASEAVAFLQPGLAMPRPCPGWFAVALVLCGACVAGPDDLPDDLTAGGKDDRGDRPAFFEVDPSHSSAAFRAYVGRAIAVLEADDSEIAQLTARAIRAGRVKIDELVDLTCWDFERARQEITGVTLTSADYARLRPGTTVADAINDELDGYMWSNRIYVSRGQPARQLASTLVHETNHVINRSEVGYWDDVPTSGFVHEYRAFYAERMFDPAPLDGIDLADHVIELYDLDRAAIDPDVLADPLSPRLLPDADAWRERRVSADPVDDDASCPGNLPS
jgi:hypothetical protein